jgi:hypothetical protein
LFLSFSCRPGYAFPPGDYPRTPTAEDVSAGLAPAPEIDAATAGDEFVGGGALVGGPATVLASHRHYYEQRFGPVALERSELETMIEEQIFAVRSKGAEAHEPSRVLVAIRCQVRWAGREYFFFFFVILFFCLFFFFFFFFSSQPSKPQKIHVDSHSTENTQAKIVGRGAKKERRLLVVARNWCGAYALFMVEARGWRGGSFVVESALPLVEGFKFVDEKGKKDDCRFTVVVDSARLVRVVCTSKRKMRLAKALTLAYEMMLYDRAPLAPLPAVECLEMRVASVRFADRFGPRPEPLVAESGAQDDVLAVCVDGFFCLFLFVFVISFVQGFSYI